MSRHAVVCDDDKLFLRWMSRLLTEWGWTVETAQTTELALILLKRELPGLLIQSLFCGDKSAVDIFEGLKQTPHGNTLPVLVIYSGSEQEASGLLSGRDVVAFLSKPLDVASLKAAVDQVSSPPAIANSTSIVVLDQGGVLQKATARVVEDAGAFPIIAASAEHTLTLLRNVQPEGIIADCDAGATELESLSQYCAENHLSLPPIIALASAINEQLVKRMLKAGVVDILLKPVSVPRLQEAIHRVAGERREQITGTGGGHSVLVVEDFTITAKMLERMLAKDGYRVHIARSGEMAIEMVRSLRPDMLLVDLNLPGMTGTELLESLLGTGQAVPSIVVTGEKDERKLQGLKKLGVMRVFRKPVIQEELLSYIDGFFARGPDSSSNVSKYQVLLAMADEAAAKVLMSALHQQKVESKIVTDGYQAINELAGSPRVAVVDIVIGGLDGTEILRRAHARQNLQTRLLAVAEEFDDEILKELKGLGAHDAIGKPYSLPRIVEKIRALLNETSPLLTAKELGSEILPMIKAAQALPGEEFFPLAKTLGHNLAGVAGLAMMPEVAQMGRELEEAAVSRKRSRSEELMTQIRVALEKAEG